MCTPSCGYSVEQRVGGKRGKSMDGEPWRVRGVGSPVKRLINLSPGGEHMGIPNLGTLLFHTMRPRAHFQKTKNWRACQMTWLEVMGLTRESFAEEVRLERIRQASWATGWLFWRGRVRFVPRFAGGVCEGIVLSRGAVRHQRMKGSARALYAAPSPTRCRGPAPACPWRPPPTLCPRPSLKPTRGEGTLGRGDVVFSLQRPLEALGISSF